MFLEWYNKEWNNEVKNNIIGLDLSYCKGVSYYVKSSEEK